MRDRGRHAFAAETVERPDEQQVELASRSADKHCCELLSVFGASATILVLDVFVDDRVAHTPAPLAELPKLVLRILPFIVRRDPGVDRGSHSHEMFLL